MCGTVCRPARQGLGSIARGFLEKRTHTIGALEDGDKGALLVGDSLPSLLVDQLCSHEAG